MSGSIELLAHRCPGECAGIRCRGNAVLTIRQGWLNLRAVVEQILPRLRCLLSVKAGSGDHFLVPEQHCLRLQNQRVCVVSAINLGNRTCQVGHLVQAFLGHDRIQIVELSGIHAVIERSGEGVNVGTLVCCLRRLHLLIPRVGRYFGVDYGDLVLRFVELLNDVLVPLIFHGGECAVPEFNGRAALG